MDRPGENWPLAGTHRGHAGLADVLRKASEEVEMTYPEPPEYVAQGDRGMVVGVATGKIKGSVRNLVRGAGFILGLEPVSKDDSELSPRFEPFSRWRFPSVACVVENQIQ